MASIRPKTQLSDLTSHSQLRYGLLLVSPCIARKTVFDDPPDLFKASSERIHVAKHPIVFALVTEF
jgi:hypothetical protein